jgi:hypothetical protein
MGSLFLLNVQHFWRECQTFKDNQPGSMSENVEWGSDTDQALFKQWFSGEEFQQSRQSIEKQYHFLGDTLDELLEDDSLSRNVTVFLLGMKANLECYYHLHLDFVYRCTRAMKNINKQD